jgi:HJR/Mrr/RecB family endonuclease
MGVGILKAGLRPIQPETFELFPEEKPCYSEPSQRQSAPVKEKWTNEYLQRFNHLLSEKNVAVQASGSGAFEILYPTAMQLPAPLEQTRALAFKLPWIFAGIFAIGFVASQFTGEIVVNTAATLITISILGFLILLWYLAEIKKAHQSRIQCLEKERRIFAENVVNAAGQVQRDLDLQLALAEDIKAKQAATNTYLKRLSEWDERRKNFYIGLSATELLVRRLEIALGAWLSEFSIPQVNYSSDERILIVDGWLPSSQVVESRLRGVERRPSQKLIQDSYEDTLYQSSLRAIYEAYAVDFAELLDVVVFNGWVRYIDLATGKQVEHCVLSLQAAKPEFISLNLTQVEAKACFRGLKGIVGGKLFSMTPVKPILQLDTNDHRFVSSYDVADSLSDSLNLAAMDWLDFENLIREIFGKEFGALGGEVKLTQSSRDGGVDAVAFDPDPIRGGKIVIQAKRYTNVVGVSAVRDLYGTILNEGANKGILVTTSYFGVDAYQFAKDKPITLINGSHLLHLLQKHGYGAKIDLSEARELRGK